MNQHFEEVWEDAEKLMSEETAQRFTKSIVMELTAKFGLYEAIDLNEKLSTEEKQKLKAHLMGTLLVTIAQLSLKDNINVFESMKLAIEEKRIEQLTLKYR